VQCTPDDVGAFADVALRRRNTVGTIVGPAAVVAALWEQIEPRWAKPREIRPDQPHLEMGRVPTIAADSGVRVTTPQDLDRLYPACVAMYTEEVGVTPENDAGGGDLYRARVQQLIGRGWSMASFDDQGVVFKAEIACVTPYAAQVQGVWVRPDRRGEGLATGGMAAVGRPRHLLRRGTGGLALRQRVEHRRAGGLREGRLRADGDLRDRHVLARSGRAERFWSGVYHGGVYAHLS
jgi:predicted GNAT family acetyltransferase